MAKKVILTIEFVYNDGLPEDFDAADMAYVAGTTVSEELSAMDHEPNGFGSWYKVTDCLPVDAEE